MNNPNLLKIVALGIFFAAIIGIDWWLRKKELSRKLLWKDARVRRAQEKWNEATEALGEWLGSNRYASDQHPHRTMLLDAEFKAYGNYLQTRGSITESEMAELQRLKTELEKARKF